MLISRIAAIWLILNISIFAIDDSRLGELGEKKQVEHGNHLGAEANEKNNGVFASVGVLNLFVTPSIGYIRFITDRFFLISYFNYSYADVPDVLQSFKDSTHKNIDSERTGYLFAIGPEYIFHTFNWPGAKTHVFFGLLVGYYSFNVNLKPGTEGGGSPAPPTAVTGSGSWQGIAAGANIGIHAKLNESLFFLFAFGMMLGQTRDVDFKATESSGTTTIGVYKNYSGNYSFSPQITIGVGVSF